MSRFQVSSSAVFHLFFPHICVGCGSDILPVENVLCLTCLNDLPFTNFAFHSNNAAEKIFWGRVPVRSVMALFYFTKVSIVQNLIHEFKYKGNKDLGKYLGILIGENLAQTNRFRDISVIIPLPLFKEKEKRRGYNQSEILSQGIAESMEVPLMTHNVIRIVDTETQTKKGRLERWKNVDKTFQVLHPEQLQNKHILLVDDVITTGATLEACASEILKISNTTVSIASLALSSG